MAISEACGLWIEQRVKEELEAKKETGASLRDIGRIVASEVEKYFETKVNPETIKSKALRMQAGSNEPPTENPTTAGVAGGDSGDKPTIQDATKIMDKEVQKGKSTREAAKVAAEKTGQNEESVRKAHQRAGKKKQEEDENQPEPESKKCPSCGSFYPGYHKHCPNQCEKKATAAKSEGTDAHQCCTTAISQLSRIRQDDIDKIPELIKVLDWIVEQIHDSGDNNALATCANKLESYINHEKVPGIPNCRGRKLTTQERDDILLQVEKLYPGDGNGWKRACALNEAGLKCGRDKKSFWTPKEVRENLRHAKNRRAAEGSE